MPKSIHERVRASLNKWNSNCVAYWYASIANR
jgi:hypothetical protein